MTQIAVLMSADSASSSLVDAPTDGAFDAIHLAFPSLTATEVALAIHRLLQAGFAIVPIHPHDDVLSSMLRRHQSHRDAQVDIDLMAKLHEEVVGLGVFNRSSQDAPGPGRHPATAHDHPQAH